MSAARLLGILGGMSWVSTPQSLPHSPGFVELALPASSAAALPLLASETPVAWLCAAPPTERSAGSTVIAQSEPCLS